MRFGTVTLVGRSNVGKSTFLNWALGQRLAITSPLPQTTRDALLGVGSFGDAQIAFLDTPGLHRPRTELGRRMNQSALDASRSADVCVMVTDIWAKEPARPVTAPTDSVEHFIRPGDADVIQEIRARRQGQRILLINKVDLTRNKDLLLPMLQAYGALGIFDELIPVSVLRQLNVDAAMQAIAQRLPEGPPGYDADTLTDRPMHFFIREYIREAILNQLKSEVPHAVAVSVDQVDERATSMRIMATIHVEKTGQRKIVVGKGGEQIKAIGIAARGRIEELTGKKVHLELFVRITPAWKDMPRQLAELGYQGSGGSSSPEEKA